ncbi:MAG: hypothetical protein KGL39_14150 [Patescibacteria group bacterium]|nr:hypothetical protein [Patescibacteria group bacterium]
MSLVDLTPTQDGLLVKVIPDHRAPSPILLPVGAAGMTPNSNMWATRYKVRWAEVLRTGPGIKSPKNGRVTPVEVQPGDIVSFAGMTKAEDGDYVLICQRDVLLIEGREN